MSSIRTFTISNTIHNRFDSTAFLVSFTFTFQYKFPKGVRGGYYTGLDYILQMIRTSGQKDKSYNICKLAELLQILEKTKNFPKWLFEMMAPTENLLCTSAPVSRDFTRYNEGLPSQLWKRQAGMYYFSNNWSLRASPILCLKASIFNKLKGYVGHL